MVPYVIGRFNFVVVAVAIAISGAVQAQTADGQKPIQPALAEPVDSGHVVTNVLGAGATVTPPSEVVNAGGPVAEIVKLVNAGIGKDVIQMFVESSTVPYTLSADDLIVLKQRGVPDEIAAAMLKRSAEIRTQTAAARAQPQTLRGGDASTAVRGPVRIIDNSAALDPDSYAYFHRYYLHPRAVAAAYQRLAAPGPFSPYRPFPGPFYGGAPGWGGPGYGGYWR